MERPEQFIESFNQLVDQHLGDASYSIEDICRAMGVSRSQLFRVLKEQTGLSPSRYIRQRRLLKAKELLESSDLKIAEITYQIGLDSPQTFTKFFTEDYGISPSEYRKNNQSTTAPAATAVDKAEHSLETLPLQRARRLVWLYVGIAALLLSLGLGWMYWHESSSTPSEDLSIVILPFAHANKPDEPLLADGIFEQIHSSVARIQNLRVISRNSSMLFANTTKAIPQIAQELKVAYVLDGNIKQLDNEVSISVEFIKAAEDRVVWTKTFRGKASNTNAFFRAVVQEITGALHQKLNSDAPHKIDRIITENFEAYQEYLQGKHLMQKRTQETLRASIVRFDKAIVLEPDFADAYANKASAYFILGSLSNADLKECIKLSEQNALTAIRLDPQNALAYATLANGYRQLNKWEQSLATYQIALKYSPNDAQINYWYSITLRSLGFFDEAIQYSTKALSLDPLHPTVVAGHIGNFSYAHRFEEAEKVLNDYELSLRDFHTYYYVKGFFYINQGDFARAITTFRTYDSLNAIRPAKVLSLFCKAKLGDRKATENFLRTIPPTLENSVDLAVLYAGLGDKDNCIKYLNLGADNGYIPEYLKVSPLFSFLRSDPRFRALLKKLGLNDPVNMVIEP